MCGHPTHRAAPTADPPAPTTSPPPAFPARSAIALIRLYQLTLGPFLGGRCRFYPSCSVYATDACREWGAFRGVLLTLRRLARCHPLGGSGIDLVPPRPRSSANPK